MSHIFLYIDPGSGSYLVQLIIAGILGSMFFFKNTWNKIKQFFGGKKPEQTPDNEL